MPESIQIQDCTIADIERAAMCSTLLDDYAAESAISEFGPAAPRWEMYAALEKAGILHAIAVYMGDVMVGFATIIVNVVPHFGEVAATTESFYVTESARSTGAGLKLLKAAEDKAKALGALVFFVSSPVGSKLEQVMDKLKPYRNTNRVWMRGLQ